MYRYAYVGYPTDNSTVKINVNSDIYYSVVAFSGERTFIYVESPSENFDIDDVLVGNFKPFPDGCRVFRMERYFHCDDFSDDSILTIPREERKPVVSLRMFEHDAPVLAYIGHHYVLQEDGKTVWNRYYSIYGFANTMLSVCDEVSIPAPRRNSPFAVDVKSVIDATRPVIAKGSIPWDENTPEWKILTDFRIYF